MEQKGANLLGEYRHGLDEKNRLIIPSRFREKFKSFVLTPGLEGCLFLYPFPEWERLRKKFREIPTSQPEIRAFLRLLFAGAVWLTPDSQGRIVIPQNLKEYAEIKEKVVIIGVLNKIEIWSEQRWENYLREKRKIFESLGEKIMGVEI